MGSGSTARHCDRGVEVTDTTADHTASLTGKRRQRLVEERFGYFSGRTLLAGHLIMFGVLLLVDKP